MGSAELSDPAGRNAPEMAWGRGCAFCAVRHCLYLYPGNIPLLHSAVVFFLSDYLLYWLGFIYLMAVLVMGTLR